MSPEGVLALGCFQANDESARSLHLRERLPTLDCRSVRANIVPSSRRHFAAPGGGADEWAGVCNVGADLASQCDGRA